MTRGPTAPNARPGDSSQVGCTSEGCPLTKVIKRENLIVVGSEMSYKMFWLKMMFIAAAYVVASRGKLVRAADFTTVAYVKEGYTKLELGALEQLKNSGVKLVALSGSGDLSTYMNNRPTYQEGDTLVTKLLQDMVFFAHGLPSEIRLNYSGSTDVDFGRTEVNQVGKSVFVPDGRIFSYACRTGTYDSWVPANDDVDAKPDKSLAQKMADHFGVEVHAFLRKTNYGGVLRNKSDSEAIAAAVREGRKTKEGQVINISDEHEALPHKGLSDTWGGRKEGIAHYALWRKAGGIDLPTVGSVPKGMSDKMWLFKPGVAPTPGG